MSEAAPFLIQGGALTVFAGILAMFYRSAVNAHKRRADEWYEAWKLERQISAEANQQLNSVIGAIQHATEEAR